MKYSYNMKLNTIEHERIQNQNNLINLLVTYIE